MAWNSLRNDKERWAFLFNHKNDYELTVHNDTIEVQVRIPARLTEGFTDDDHDELRTVLSCLSFKSWDMESMLKCFDINVKPA